MNMCRKIQFSPPDIGEDEIKEVVNVLKSGWITTGPKTKELEKEVAKYTNTKYAATFNSATAGLEMVLRLFGIGENDEVIVPAYTYTATASVVCHIGAKPVMVDVVENEFTFDLKKLEKAITKNTKAIIPVDFAGIMADYNSILRIVEDKKHLFTAKNKYQEELGRILILADAAHSFGAFDKDKKSGEVADFTVFSFHAVKNLTTAEGGAVTFNDLNNIKAEEIYKEFMLLSLHGQSKDALEKTRLGSFEYDILGAYYKCNMTDVHAAIGLATLRRYDKILEKRKKIVDLYEKHLNFTNISTLKHYGNDFSGSFHLYPIRFLGEDISYRNKFIEEMAKNNIATNVHYKPLPMLTAYKKMGFNIDDFQNAYNQYKNEMTLPLHTLLTEDDIFYIAETFNKIRGTRS